MSHKGRFILSLYNHIQFFTRTLVFSSIADIHASAKHEDCEKPPEVENASVNVRIDENEEFVTATYRCSDGYKLNGKAIITCDLDIDEWQENPPTCEQQSKYYFCSTCFLL